MNINNCLDDDSLIYIFKKLPVLDKLKIELVCKRWRNLGMLSWSSVKSLRICKAEFKKKDEYDSYFNGINKKVWILFRIFKSGWRFGSGPLNCINRNFKKLSEFNTRAFS